MPAPTPVAPDPHPWSLVDVNRPGHPEIGHYRYYKDALEAQSLEKLNNIEAEIIRTPCSPLG